MKQLIYDEYLDENYVFDEKEYLKGLKARHREELQEYLKTTPMTDEEKKAVREWVKDGHSVYENYALHMEEDGRTPVSFLEVYRMDQEIIEGTRGMTNEEAQAWIYENYYKPEPVLTSEDEDDELPF